MDKKILWFDTETTGVEKECDLFQIAGIIVINGIVTEEFDIKSRPFDDTLICKEALEVTKVTESEILNYKPANEAYEEFKTILLKYIDPYNRNDKFWLGGHNIGFDFDFLVRWSKKNNDKFLGSLVSYKDHFCTLKVVQALKFINKFKHTENNKLEILAKALNISFDGMAHDALFDVRVTRLLGIELLKKLNTIN